MKLIFDNLLIKGLNIGFDVVVEDDGVVFSWNDKINF